MLPNSEEFVNKEIEAQSELLNSHQSLSPTLCLSSAQSLAPLSNKETEVPEE
jgi:hypothetical protein